MLKDFTYDVQFNFSNLKLADFGLDVEHNFLVAPRCECGCDGVGYLILKEDVDILSLCNELVSEYECEYCGVFVLKSDMYLLGAIKDEDEISLFCSKTPIELDYIGGIADGLCCYGLIVAAGKDQYLILEE